MPPDEDTGAPIRVVIDTSCLLRYLIRPGSAIKQLIEIWLLEDRIQFVTSPELLAELQDVLGRSRMRAIIQPDEAGALVDTVRNKAEILPPLGPVPPYSRDAKDDKFVACAIAARAACLITVDRDLLALGSIGDVAVMEPHTFLAQAGQPRGPA